MYTFKLDNTAPNQKFTITMDGHTFTVELHTAYDMLFATVDVDNVRVKTSCRCVHNGWLIPYMSYAPEGCGNLKFVTKNGEYPSYKNFNSTCTLVYATREEYDNQ